MMLLESSIRATVVIGLVALLLAALRVRASEVRHAVWTAVLAAMLLMPILPRVLPAIDLRLPANAAALSVQMPAPLVTDQPQYPDPELS